MLPSATSAATAAMITRCERLSKNPWMSASSTTRYPWRWSSSTSLDRLVAVASGDESVRVLVKLWFKDRGKKPSNHFLSDPISHHRNAERSKLRRAGAFGDVDTAQRQGPERSRFQLPHQRREVFLEVGSEHLNADLVHPRGPAIPLDGLEGLSHELGGDPPGQRMYLDLFHGEPFTRCNHEVRTSELLGAFLSVAAVAAFPWFPGKSAGRPFCGLSQGANFPHGLARRSPSSVGFSFHFALGREATPDLLLPLKRRRLRRPSPHRRVAGPFRLWLIGSAYRPSDGGGLHRSWLGTIFSRRRHASPAWSTSGNPLNRRWGERFGLSSALRRRAVSGAPTGRKCRLPEIAEFEQGVLYGCGPAQVGFGDQLSSFHRLTLSSSLDSQGGETR